MIDGGNTELHLKGEEPLSLETEIEPFRRSCPLFTTARPTRRKHNTRCRKKRLDSIAEVCVQKVRRGASPSERVNKRKSGNDQNLEIASLAAPRVAGPAVTMRSHVTVHRLGRKYGKSVRLSLRIRQR